MAFLHYTQGCKSVCKNEYKCRPFTFQGIPNDSTLSFYKQSDKGLWSTGIQIVTVHRHYRRKPGVQHIPSNASMEIFTAYYSPIFQANHPEHRALCSSHKFT